MDERKRQELLERVNRSSLTIGEEIPEELTVQNETINLKEFVFECQDLDGLSLEHRDQIEELKHLLQRERLERKRRIQRNKITREEGERLARSIHGIDRALNALESIDGPGIEEQVRRKQIQDARELLGLIEQARV